MAIVTRAGKGAQLLHTELDNNFTELDTRTTAAQTAATNAATTASQAQSTATSASTTAGQAQSAASTASTNASAALTAANAAVKTVNGQSPDGAGNVTVSGGGSASNLSLGTRTSTTVPIANSGGTGLTIPAADSSLAGAMIAADKVKLDALPTAAALTTSLNAKQGDLGLADSAALNARIDGRLPAVPSTTDSLTEGSTRLYFTAARVLATVLTGLSTATNSAVVAADTLLVAIGKLQAQISDKLSASAATFTGIVTSAWANVMSPTPMAGLAIDVTKIENTKSVSAASTFTLSATPATGTVFGLELTNSSATPVTITLPAGTFFSRLRQATITTFTLPANGRLNIFFKYDGTRYLVVGEPGPLNNYNASAAPTTSDNATTGYDLGSVWTTTAEASPASGVWLLSDLTPVTWTRLDTSGGGGTTVEDLLTSTSTTNALSANQGRLLDLSTKTSNITAVTGTTYTLVAADAGKVVEATNAAAVTVTIPTNATVPYPVGTVLSVRQGGAGAVTIAAASGVTINKPAARTLTTSAQYEQAVLQQTALNTWLVIAS